MCICMNVCMYLCLFSAILSFPLPTVFTRITKKAHNFLISWKSEEHSKKEMVTLKLVIVISVAAEWCQLNAVMSLLHFVFMSPLNITSLSWDMWPTLYCDKNRVVTDQWNCTYRQVQWKIFSILWSSSHVCRCLEYIIYINRIIYVYIIIYSLPKLCTVPINVSGYYESKFIHPSWV